jgi:hypothetical protein
MTKDANSYIYHHTIIGPTLKTKQLCSNDDEPLHNAAEVLCRALGIKWVYEVMVYHYVLQLSRYTIHQLYYSFLLEIERSLFIVFSFTSFSIDLLTRKGRSFWSNSSLILNGHPIA